MRLVAVSMAMLVLFMTGCASGVKKHSAQSQPSMPTKGQEVYQEDTFDLSYVDERNWSSEVYGQKTKKTSVNSEERLSTKQIQRALKKADFYKGEIDGKIGPKTKEAIIKFQKAHSLKADGIVGQRTSAELKKYLL